MRDPNGSLICVRIYKIRRKWSIKLLEAKTILEGIKCIFYSWSRNEITFEIESDSMEVISAMNGTSEDLMEMKNLVNVIISTSSLSIFGGFQLL